MKAFMTVIYNRRGSVLSFVVMSLVILSILGLGLLTISYGVRFHAVKVKNEAVSMLAAEAGYEKAVFWMGQQSDMINYLKAHDSYSDSIAFPNSNCNYEVSLFSFLGSRPVYHIVSNGLSGSFTKTVDVLVLQAIGGWEMGICRVPTGSFSTSPVYFTSGEIIDMPVHINKVDDSPDDSRDIFLSGDPQFLQTVSMGESRYTDADEDKYSDVINVFDEGIVFDQPSSRITDETAIQTKVQRFEDSTKSEYTFTPLQKYSFGSGKPALPATQLEFFVDGEVGKVRITNNCTVRGFQQIYDSRTYDFKIKPGTDGGQFERYNIYAYHVAPSDADATGERVTQTIESTYVTQVIGGVESEPGGQIFIDGNVIIGGNDTLHSNAQVVKGKITVVATGNIWVADSVVLDGAHDVDGMPSSDNTNALGLISQGVVKVADPGMSTYYGSDGGSPPSGSAYAPIGFPDTSSPVKVYKRYLPNSMVVEAGVTVGGGGWGAENVKRGSYGGRKEYGSSPDDLILRGTITEAIRGVVGLADGSDGFSKNYYFDARFLEGILPGDMWLRGKYIPAPAGWKDYRTSVEE